jgi:L-methionine (R)-S-oxide reductase
MDRYRALQPQWIALLEGEVNCMANLANLSAAIYTAFDWHWVGFYVVDQHRDELVLAPFQGPVACTRLQCFVDFRIGFTGSSGRRSRGSSGH